MSAPPEHQTMLVHIPADIDLPAVLGELNDAGWRDYKIEVLCGFSRGYVAQLKAGNIANPSLLYAARLWNLWVDVMLEANKPTSHSPSTGRAL